MDAERTASYARFIMDPLIDGPKIMDEIKNTPFLDEYPLDGITTMAKPLHEANGMLERVSQLITDGVEEQCAENKSGKPDLLLREVQAFLYPPTASLLASSLSLGSMDALIIAASHVAVSKYSELFIDESDSATKDKLRLCGLYFADAQVKVLGFKTSTTLLSMDLNDPNLLRRENIMIIQKFETEEELKKTRIKAIFTGLAVRDLGKGKFIID